MKKIIKYAVFLLFMLAVFWPSPAYARERFDDKVVFGGTYTLETGQSLDGNLVIFGGAVTTESGSSVNGDVALIGGIADIGGTVSGNVVGIGGAVQLTSSAVVNGDLVTIGATLSREDGARVNGQIVNGIGIPFTFELPESVGRVPDLPDVPAVPDVPQFTQPPGINISFNPLLEMMWFFFRTFMFALLAVLVVIFFERSTGRVARAAINQPVITAGAGLLTACLAPLALIAMTLTIILIPVTLLTAFVLVVACLFGWIAIGLEVGGRIAKLFNTEWAPAVSAGIGTFLIFLVLGGFSELIACVGWVPMFLVGLWGLGAVIMTRFGSHEYTPTSGTGTGALAVAEPGMTVDPVAQTDSIDEPGSGITPLADRDSELDASREGPPPEDDGDTSPQE